MTVLDRLRGGLIVSVQADPGSAIDDAHVIAAMARAAQDNGAVAVRIRGVEQIRAVRAAVGIPVIGLIKRAYDGFEPYITPTLREVDEVLACGAEIVAFDATLRPHPSGAQIGALVSAIHDGGALAMADCAVLADAVAALGGGADLVGTTLHGYTKETNGAALPALGLVRELRAALGGFVVCEGGIASPEGGRAALDAGADAIVVGTAITNIDRRVGEFVRRLAN